MSHCLPSWLLSLLLVLLLFLIIIKISIKTDLFYWKNMWALSSIIIHIFHRPRYVTVQNNSKLHQFFANYTFHPSNALSWIHVNESVPSSVLHILECTVNRSEFLKSFHTKGSTTMKVCHLQKSDSDTMMCVGI